MADEDLFASDAAPVPPVPVVDTVGSTTAPIAPAAPQGFLAGKIAEFEALVNAHFPHNLAGGTEAHQPIREFLLGVKALFDK